MLIVAISGRGAEQTAVDGAQPLDSTTLPGTGTVIGGPVQSDSNVLEGFPRNSAEAIALVKSSQAVVTQFPFQPPGDGGQIGEGQFSIVKTVDINSSDAKQRATTPSSQFNVADIVTGSGHSNSPTNSRGNSGVFHVACTTSHFSYADPIAKPGEPGAAHLHMFFGNTEVNAYSNSDSMLNTGNGTCQHEELNRTGYWVPAMLDGEHHAIRPDFIQVYYDCLLYTSPSPRDATLSRMPSSA